MFRNILTVSVLFLTMALYKDALNRSMVPSSRNTKTRQVSSFVTSAMNTAGTYRIKIVMENKIFNKNH